MMYLININHKLIKIILKYTNKIILSYLLGILLVIWYVEVSWGNLLTIHTDTERTPYFLNGNIRFYDTFNENKPNLIYKNGKNDRIKVSLNVFMCPGVSCGILGVIRLTPVIVLCFVVCNFVSILAVLSSELHGCFA